MLKGRQTNTCDHDVFVLSNLVHWIWGVWDFPNRKRERNQSGVHIRLVQPQFQSHFTLRSHKTLVHETDAGPAKRKERKAYESGHGIEHVQFVLDLLEDRHTLSTNRHCQILKRQCLDLYSVHGESRRKLGARSPEPANWPDKFSSTEICTVGGRASQTSMHLDAEILKAIFEHLSIHQREYRIRHIRHAASSKDERYKKWLT